MAPTAAAKSLPTVEIVGPGGRLVINESDLEAYRARGYHLCSEPTTAPVEGAPEPNNKEPKPTTAPEEDAPEPPKKGGKGK